jgi:mannose-6-phosphate isomerase-like protein (cupin superfamily)
MKAGGMDTLAEIRLSRMSEVIVIPPREGELIGDAPDRRVEILSDHPSLHATWSRFGPGREGADLHVHRRHTDLFYVLSGELTIRLGLEDRQVTVAAGRLVRVPPMVVHGFRNASDAEVTYLNLHAPGMEFAEFLRAGRDGREFSYDQFGPPAEGVRSASEAVVGDPVARVAEIEVEELVAEPGEQRAQPGRVVFLYVLEGAAAGTWVQVPPGTAHPRLERTRHLEIRTPAGG